METLEFVEDIYPPQFLYGKTIRSPAVKGRILSVECPQLPPNYMLITAKDIPGNNRLMDTDIPILAQGSVSYYGEPVALLFGPNHVKLDELFSQCQVIVEEEKPFFTDELFADIPAVSIPTPVESVTAVPSTENPSTDKPPTDIPTAPTEAPDTPSADSAAETVPESVALKNGPQIPPEMILAERQICAGNPDAAFEQCKNVVRCTYHTGIQDHWYAEPHGAVIQFENDTLVVHTATQWPSHVQRSLAGALAIAPNLIRVAPTAIGMHMDGKLWYPSLVACHAALGAVLAKSAVRFMLTREEDFRFSPKRNKSIITIAGALDENGAIQGMEIDLTVDLGASGIDADEILDQSCLGALGIYCIDNIKVRGRALKSNIPPQGAFCGFGIAQGSFAIERHISHIADVHNMGPAEWRLGHSLKTASLPLGLAIKESPPLQQLFETVFKASDYKRRWASFELIRRSKHSGGDENKQAEERSGNFRGIGLAFGYQGSGFLYSGAVKENYAMELTLDKDGFLEIKTGISSSDSDFHDTWACIAAEILGIEASAVRINSSADAPDAGPGCSSRNAAFMTKVMQNACIEISKRRFRDPLPITVSQNLQPKKNSRWAPVLAAPAGKKIDASGFTHPGWAAAVVDLEVDPVEYIPRIRGVWLSVDGGKILSEQKARRNLKLSVIQAIGWVAREQVKYIDGVLPLSQYHNYKIPAPIDVPPIHIDFIESAYEEPKGIGDLPFSCVPAAFVQAVSQAVDYHFEAIPLHPRELWEAVKTAGIPREEKSE